MRVVAINRFFWPDHSATSQLLTDLARHLARQGHAVTVVAGRQRYGEREAEGCPPSAVRRHRWGAFGEDSPRDVVCRP